MPDRTYSQEALERIKLKGKVAILNFLQEVPHRDARQILSGFPSPKGFRPHTKAGIDAQKERIATSLSDVTARSNKIRANSIKAMVFFWHSWGQHKLNAPELIESYMNKIDEALDKKETEKPVEEIDVWLFSELRDLSTNNKCTKEDLSNFLQFSPIAELTSIEEIVSTAKEAKKVERDRRIRGLPREIEDLHVEVEGHGKKLKRIEKLQKVVGEKTDELVKCLEKLDKSDTEKKKQLKLLDKANKHLDSTVKDMIVQSEQFKKKIETDIQLINEDNNRRESDTKRAFSSLSKAIHDLEEQCLEINETVEAVEKRLLSEIKKVDHKVESLSLEGNTPPRETPRPHQSDIAKPVPNCSLPIRNLYIPQTANEAKKMESVLDSLTTSLQCEGVGPRESKEIGKDLLASMLSQQMPLLVGHVAGKLAKAVVKALAPHSHIWFDVDIGSYKNVSLDRLSSYFPESKYDKPLKLVVINGINRSPFELYGTEIGSQVLDEALGLTSKNSDCIYLGIVDSTDFSLPATDLIGRFGPIFDVDKTNWRFGRKLNEMNPTYVSTDMWAQHVKAISDNLPTAEEINEITEEFDLNSDRAWKYIILRAYRSLEAIYLQNDELLPQLLLRWLYPKYISDQAGSELELSDSASEILVSKVFSSTLLTLMNKGSD